MNATESGPIPPRTALPLAATVLTPTGPTSHAAELPAEWVRCREYTEDSPLSWNAHRLPIPPVAAKPAPYRTPQNVPAGMPPTAG